MSTGRVLVADDDAGTRNSLAMLLRLWGFEAITACDGPEALQAVQLHHPDIILLDFSMPGFGGPEVAKCVREQVEARQKRPFMVSISGYTDAQTRQRAQEAGVDLHLVKPVDPDQLERLFRRFQSVTMPSATTTDP
jgi:CheY-like chemotaxis protein